MLDLTRECLQWQCTLINSAHCAVDVRFVGSVALRRCHIAHAARAGCLLKHLGELYVDACRFDNCGQCAVEALDASRVAVRHSVVERVRFAALELDGAACAVVHQLNVRAQKERRPRVSTRQSAVCFEESLGEESVRLDAPCE